MKGISPIIASVLLIAITMSIAVVLAAYVTSYTREATQNLPTACVGGALYFVTGSPQLSTTDCKITASVESQFVELSSFKIDVNRNGVITSGLSTTGASSLAPGDSGTVFATLSTPCTDVSYVRVSTNCYNVKTDWETPTVT
jgi:flagellin-like protein